MRRDWRYLQGMTLSPAHPRSILITGASSGIGLASVRVLKARGWRVLATARKDDDLARLEREEDVEALRLDLGDPASVAACAGEARSRTAGRLTALFNNGAYGQLGAVEDLTADVLRRQLEVNVVGTLHVLEAADFAAFGHSRDAEGAGALAALDLDGLRD